MQLSVTPLRDQIAAPARTILLVLLAASAVVFVIACSNVANLILARSVRREGELAVRAALGASHGALRRTLLAESLVLCGAGALLGVLLARPLVAVVALCRALLGASPRGDRRCQLLWVGGGLAMAAAVLLAFIPRLPSPHAPAGLGLTSGSVRLTPGTNRRLRVFAMTQIACSFLLLAGAGTLIAALVALQPTQTGLNLRQVLALDMPASATPRRFHAPSTSISRLPIASRPCPAWSAWSRKRRALARRRHRAAVVPFAVEGPRPRMEKRIGTRDCGTSRPDSSPRSACPSSPAATSPPTIDEAASWS